MKYLKYIIPILIIFISIGYASSKLSLSISGDVYVTSDIDDFEVYISDIKINNTSDVSMLEDSLIFNINKKTSDSKLTLNYDITNSSRKFDANINISCTSTLTPNITNTKESSVGNSIFEYIIKSRETTTNTMTIDYGSSTSTDTLKCTINATPIERTSYGTGEFPENIIKELTLLWVDEDSSKNATKGDTVNINGESFHIGSITSDNVILISDNNLNDNGLQTETENYKIIANNYVLNGSSGEMNIKEINGPVLSLIQKYEVFFDKIHNFEYVAIDLPSVNNLIDFGCSATTCENITYIHKSRSFWTKTYESNMIKVVDNTGLITYANDKASVKPIIIINKTKFDEYIK